MKKELTTCEMNLDQLRKTINREASKLNIANGTIVCCRKDGEECDCVHADFIDLTIEQWRENGRTMTEKGRAELQAENNSIERILAKAASLGFEVEEDGGGSGQYGDVKCFRITKPTKYIVKFDGEPITRLSFQADGKADITTGCENDAIRYTLAEAEEVVDAIGSGAEVEVEGVCQ